MEVYTHTSPISKLIRSLKVTLHLTSVGYDQTSYASVCGLHIVINESVQQEMP